MRSRQGMGKGWIVRAALSGLLLGILLRRVDIALVRKTWEGMREEFFLLALALYLCGQLLSALRWKVLTGPLGLSLSYGRLVALYFLGMFFNFFFPTVIGGDAVKAYYLARHTQDVARSVASILMDRNTGLCALLLIALAASAFGQVRVADRDLVLPLLGLWFLYVLGNLLLFADSTYRLLIRLSARAPRLASLIARWHEAMRAYERSPGSIVKAVGLSILFYLLLIGLNMANALALGVVPDPMVFGVFIPIISVLSMLPITLYGLGVRESAFVILFSSQGIARETSLLLALLWFWVTVLCSLPGALLYAFSRRMFPEAAGHERFASGDSLPQKERSPHRETNGFGQ